VLLKCETHVRSARAAWSGTGKVRHIHGHRAVRTSGDGCSRILAHLKISAAADFGCDYPGADRALRSSGFCHIRSLEPRRNHACRLRCSQLRLAFRMQSSEIRCDDSADSLTAPCHTWRVAWGYQLGLGGSTRGPTTVLRGRSCAQSPRRRSRCGFGLKEAATVTLSLHPAPPCTLERRVHMGLDIAAPRATAKAPVRCGSINCSNRCP
jgi:hypothetical protein